jgi:hypothetical protein
MIHQIFKTRRTGRVGPHIVGPDYLAAIEARAKRLEEAAEGRLPKKDRRQLELPVCGMIRK